MRLTTKHIGQFWMCTHSVYTTQFHHTKYTANYDIQVTTSKQKSRDQQDMIQQILLKINRM